MVVKSLDEIDELRIDALLDRNPERYIRYSKMLGLKPEDLEDPTLYEIWQVDNFFNENGMLPGFSKYQKNYDLLRKNANMSNINVDCILGDIDYKRDQLKNIMGYGSLKGVEDIENALPEQIGNVYLKCFEMGKEE